MLVVNCVDGLFLYFIKLVKVKFCFDVNLNVLMLVFMFLFLLEKFVCMEMLIVSNIFGILFIL